MSGVNDHDTLITLVERVDNLTTEIQKMSKSLENLKNSFVTRAEFDQVKIAVMGVANDGGLMERMRNLEQGASIQKGQFGVIHFLLVLGGSIITGLIVKFI